MYNKSEKEQLYLPQQFEHHDIPKGNILLCIATPLLTLMTQIRHTIEHKHVAKFHGQVIDEIKHFENKLQQANYSPRNIIAARYCLCSAMDEAVLSRTWGTKSIWVQQTLLSLFHHETWGGERFYIIVEAMAKEPRKNLEFLEFVYLLLSLGFEGKYFGENRAIREEIRNRVFYRIRYSKEKPDKTLSCCLRETSNNVLGKHSLRKLKPLVIVTTFILLCTAAYYNSAVYEAASPTITKLKHIATTSPITIFSEAIQRPILERGAADV